MCVRVDSMHVHVRACVHVRARARRKRHSRAPHIYVYMYEYMHLYECACRCHGSVRMCACAGARASVVCPSVETCVGIDACSSRHVRMPRCTHKSLHRRIGSSIYVCLQPRSSCMRVRMELYIRCRRLGMDRRASVCMYMYMYRYI
jgi:hypothetical protein